MKLLLFISLLLVTTFIYSQKTIDVDKDDVNGTPSYFVVNGNLLSTDKYVSVVEGSAYFSKEWMKGHLSLANGNYSNNNSVRLDLIANTVEYINKYGQVMIANTPIVKIKFTDTATDESFYFIRSSLVTELDKNKPGWYQVLVSGNVNLYKLNTKIVRETKAFNSSTYEQTILDEYEYYLLFHKVLYKVKKLNDLTALLKDKKEELENYIDKKNLKGKKDADYADLLNYYNSL